MDEHNWVGKRALVTGGMGFIGSHLVKQLTMAGAIVSVLDLASTVEEGLFASPTDNIELLNTDIRQIQWERELSARHFDSIFHLAANAYVPPSVADPTFDCELNFGSTFRLIEGLRKLQWQGVLVYASSAAVYGDAARMPISETDPTIPISPYGVGKLAAERYIAVFSRLYGLRAASLRLFSAYGPGQRKQVVYDLLEKLSHDPSELHMHGNGSQVRDFVYVDDVAQAAMTVAERGVLQGEVYNVGSGESHTIHELATHLCSLLGVRPTFIYAGAVRPGDPEQLSVDMGKLTSLGYRPATPFDKGLARTVEWFQASRDIL